MGFLQFHLPSSPFHISNSNLNKINSPVRRLRLHCPNSGNTRAFPCAMNIDERTSPKEIRKEIERCYNLISKLGRGVVYLGSARTTMIHPHYEQARELAKEVALLLDATSWTGAGPGLMDATMKGALEAGKPVGGFKIASEAEEGSASNFHPYLPPDSCITCKFFSARKQGLIDAAARNCVYDRTAFIALPGGVGTLDEMFEILALIQLKRIGSKLPVPFLVMNYDSFYGGLLQFLRVCEEYGTVLEGEMESLWKICDTNIDALKFLEGFYNQDRLKS